MDDVVAGLNIKLDEPGQFPTCLDNSVDDMDDTIAGQDIKQDEDGQCSRAQTTVSMTWMPPLLARIPNWMTLARALPCQDSSLDDMDDTNADQDVKLDEDGQCFRA